MKKNSNLLVFSLLLAGLLFMAFMYYKVNKENEGLRKRYLLFKGVTENCEFDTSKYLLVYMSSEKCDNIVIKNKAKAEAPIFSQKSAFVPSRLIQFAQEIDTSEASTLVERYNSNHNPDLTNTSAVNFEYDVISDYLVRAKIKNENLKYFRIYLGKYPSNSVHANKNTTVLAVSDQNNTTDIMREFYLGTDNRLVLNYGGLCPPPTSVSDLHDNGIFILENAIRKSTNGTLRGAGGIQKIP